MNWLRPETMRTATLAMLGFAGLAACSAGGGDDDLGPAGPTPQPYPEVSTTPGAEEGLARLNMYRRLAGLPEVQGDNSGEYACEGHLDYLLWEAENGKGTCYLSHTEPNHSNPHYSPENETAGKNSVIACGVNMGFKQTLSEAVDMWINTLYHRLPLLDSGLTTVGFASKNGVNCINYRPGTDTANKAERAIVWPADGMYDVPTTFVGFEAPCPTLPDNPLATNGADCSPSGFIPSVSWYRWGKMSAEPVVNLINEATGEAVPLLAWYGDGVSGHDPAKGYTPSTISMVPQDELAPNTIYRIEVDAAPGDAAPQSVRSRFTTGDRKK